MTASDDLDTLFVIGTYWCVQNNRPVNRPSNSTYDAIIKVESMFNNAGRVLQTYFEPASVGFRIWKRRRYNGTWSNWYREYDSNCQADRCVSALGYGNTITFNTPPSGNGVYLYLINVRQSGYPDYLYEFGYMILFGSGKTTFSGIYSTHSGGTHISTFTYNSENDVYTAAVDNSGYFTITLLYMNNAG